MTGPNHDSSLKQQLHKMAWRLIHVLNGAGSQPVLNDEISAPVPEMPGQELYRTAQELKAEAVDEQGRRVNYAALAEAECYQQLRRLTGALSACRLQDLGDRDQRLAFWINLYNALILDAIIRFQIGDRVPFRLFLKAAYEVCGYRFSADVIEHGVLRGNRPHPVYRLRMLTPDDPRAATAIDPFDPRIHFALNCGARSCPPIRFYIGDQIDQQLTQATASFLQGGGAQVDLEQSTLRLSPIFKWYQHDFGGRKEMLNLVASHLA
ncbi:MAG: DUF547 domain-containing protein, partial [Anaerolineales bacterium]